jgi:hypothetical protein
MKIATGWTSASTLNGVHANSYGAIVMCYTIFRMSETALWLSSLTGTTNKFATNLKLYSLIWKFLQSIFHHYLVIREKQRTFSIIEKKFFLLFFVIDKIKGENKKGKNGKLLFAKKFWQNWFQGNLLIRSDKKEKGKVKAWEKIASAI